MLYKGTDILEVAHKIELRGQAFYNKAAELVKEKAAKELLKDLAAKEASHAGFFKNLLDQLLKNQIIYHDDNEYQIIIQDFAQNHVFKDNIPDESFFTQEDSLKNIFQMALGFERDTITLFLEVGKHLDGINKTTVDQIIEEEKEHIAILHDSMRDFKLL